MDTKGVILIILGAIISPYQLLIGLIIIILGLFLIYRGENIEKGKLNNELEALKTSKEKLKNVDNEIEKSKRKLENINTEYEKKAKEKEKELENQLKEKRKELKELTEEIDIEETGSWQAQYDFINSIQYKEKLDEIRAKQKQMIKDKTATTILKEGKTRDEKTLLNTNIKQILRSFNNETEVLITKVNWSNRGTTEKKIYKIYQQLNKLYKKENVAINHQYLNLRLEELQIAYEYTYKKEEEKELLKIEREREREEAKIQKELEKEKNKFNKENNKIEEEITKIKKELTNAAQEEKEKLEQEIQELKKALEKNNTEIEKIDKEKEKTGAGYVYIISNIGSFGKDVYKIGVTRRDNPEERIRELSNASVPFRYDTHAFIFSKEAYALEKELHNKFDKQRVNKVNKRKEFFNIKLEDVRKIVQDNKTQVHSFTEKADAEEYHQTLEIENGK